MFEAFEWRTNQMRDGRIAQAAGGLAVGHVKALGVAGNEDGQVGGALQRKFIKLEKITKNAKKNKKCACRCQRTRLVEELLEAVAEAGCEAARVHGDEALALCILQNFKNKYL
jgi:hypothetical protein